MDISSEGTVSERLEHAAKNKFGNFGVYLRNSEAAYLLATIDYANASIALENCVDVATAEYHRLEGLNNDAYDRMVRAGKRLEENDGND